MWPKEEKTVLVEGKDICFSYDGSSLALQDVEVNIEKGEFLAILGCNGSGKSTLVKHFNALLPLQQGKLRVAQIDLGNEENIWLLRRLCGMVFQNPDNQFVASTVEADIAFGLENYEVPRAEIPERVRAALALVEMSGYEKRAPDALSGGQKQRVALAGVLALDPEIIIFDEATAMLDPRGRQEVLAIMDKLHRAGKTILAITHYVEEAVAADKVILMHKGRILACGSPETILTDLDLMKEAELIPPLPVRLYYDLRQAGIYLENCPLTEEELVKELWQLRSKI
ncbi:MAG: energy-coupling factor transporter ATPase [Firmicutes bacterium]|nr:energy-coupling factor transporter ATPase [Bacillota bacterium]